MSSLHQFKARAFQRVAKKFDLRCYAFSHRDNQWLIAIRGNIVILSPTLVPIPPDIADIRRLGNEKDYELFLALTGIGIRQSLRYQLVATGNFVTLYPKYNHAIFARSNQHVYSTRWRRIALAHAQYVSRRVKQPPCMQIAEDVERGKLMVALNYVRLGSFYIFVNGIPIDYAYPFHEQCSPQVYFGERKMLMKDNVVPWLGRLERTQLLPLPTPPPTLEQVFDKSANLDYHDEHEQEEAYPGTD
jgi:hypothetical protein